MNDKRNEPMPLGWFLLLLVLIGLVGMLIGILITVPVLTLYLKGATLLHPVVLPLG